jgi:hypothetical protein
VSWLEVRTDDGGTAFEPGAEVAGSAGWALDEAPGSLELRLFWYTAGKGTSDVEIVTHQPCEAVREGRATFRFRLPAEPYSFSGTLVSLTWGIELVAEPSGENARLEITVGPGGREVLLGTVAPGGDAGAG